MKYLIVASKKDKAGINITTQLSQFGDYDFYLVDEEMIFTKNIDLEKINKYDFIIFASKHSSKKKEKTLSIHAPGNWRSADFGGESGKACPTSAMFLKQTFEILNKHAKEHELKDYKVTMECTHHGPLIRFGSSLVCRMVTTCTVSAMTESQFGATPAMGRSSP